MKKLFIKVFILLSILSISLLSLTSPKINAETETDNPFILMGAQDSSIEDEEVNLRVISAIGGSFLDEKYKLDEGYGFKLELLNSSYSVEKTNSYNCTQLLTKVSANENGVNVEVTSESLNADYLFALTITGVPVGTIIRVTPFITNISGNVEYDKSRIVTASTVDTPLSSVVSDPIIADKEDFIKMPGEVITNEDFRSLVSNAYGEVNYQYTLKSGSGTLVDNLDGTFNYNPNGVYSEVAVITFKVEDGFGSIKEKDITLTYKTVNPIIYDGEVGSKVVDKADLSDLVMTIDTFGVESNTLYYEIKDILLENVSIGSENYVSTTNESQRQFTLKKEYLETLNLGIHLFTVKTACGEASFNVTVTDTSELEETKEQLDFSFYQDSDTSIVIQEINGAKYKINDNEWQSNNKIENINLEENIVIYVQIDETNSLYIADTYNKNYKMEKISLNISDEGYISFNEELISNGYKLDIIDSNDKSYQLNIEKGSYNILELINFKNSDNYLINIINSNNKIVSQNNYSYDFIDVNVSYPENLIIGTKNDTIYENIEIRILYNNSNYYIVPIFDYEKIDSNNNLTGNQQIKITIGEDFEQVISYNALSPIIIYEIYGGGGNKDATYNYDYVVLYNITESDIDLEGLSLQYVSMTSTEASKTGGLCTLTGTIKAHDFFLISGQSTDTSVGLPIEEYCDLQSNLNLSLSKGKIFLMNNTDAISNSYDFSNVLDMVGYGTNLSSNYIQYEGDGGIDALSSSESARRNNFVDTNDNKNDFLIDTPNLNYLLDEETISKMTLIGMKNVYEINSCLNIDELYLKVVYNTGKEENVDVTQEMLSPFDNDAIGEYSLEITYLDFKITVYYSIIEKINYDYPTLLSDPESVEIIYIDLGKYGYQDCGESALIKLGNIEILVDAGDSYSDTFNAINEVLQSKVEDGNIEYLIATHSHSDHIGSMEEVFSNYNIENVIRFNDNNYTTLVYKDFVNAYENQGSKVLYISDILNEQDSFSYYLAPNVTMTFYETGYLSSSVNPNYTSLVFVLKAFDTKVLFNGDCEELQENNYSPLVGDIDILKLGHHGTQNATMSQSIEILKPEIAIITNGNHLGNQYGHPTSYAISRLYEYNPKINVYSTTGGGGSDFSYTMSDNGAIAKQNVSPTSDYTLTSGRFYQRNGTITVTINDSSYTISSEREEINGRLIEISSTNYWLEILKSYTNGIFHVD